MHTALATAVADAEPDEATIELADQLPHDLQHNRRTSPADRRRRHARRGPPIDLRHYSVGRPAPSRVGAGPAVAARRATTAGQLVLYGWWRVTGPSLPAVGRVL
jgi:hypothetical protein